MARASVHRQGTGLSAAQVADKSTEAARREQETSKRLDSSAARLRAMRDERAGVWRTARW
ncbi:hypothetical protein [Streptomyces sp. cg40]|uniref:hypothetical protein n=1 Tax=Streptomyces sp. cg40 TaxID=3419764 RepID=UPI003D06602B